MKNLFSLIILILLLSCVSDGNRNQSNDAGVLNNDTISKINNFGGKDINNQEKEYLRVRNEYIKYFKNIDFEKDTSIYRKDQQALAYLEIRLRDILKGAHVKNISNEGKINLETLTKALKATISGASGRAWTLILRIYSTSSASADSQT